MEDAGEVRRRMKEGRMWIVDARMGSRSCQEGEAGARSGTGIPEAKERLRLTGQRKSTRCSTPAGQTARPEQEGRVYGSQGARKKDR